MNEDLGTREIPQTAKLTASKRQVKMDLWKYDRLETLKADD